MSKKRHRSSGSPSSQKNANPLIGIPSFGSAGLTAAPLDVIGGSFRDAIAWLKSGPPDDFTSAELLLIKNAENEMLQGHLDSAIAKLHQLHKEQEARRKRGVVRMTIYLFRRRKQPTIVRILLANLLNFCRVERVNKAIKEFQRETSGDIMNHLRAMARSQFWHGQTETHPIFDTDILNPTMKRLLRGREDLLADMLRQKGYSYQSIGKCEVCGRPAVGELRQSDGKSFKLCQKCAKNAQSIVDEHNKHRRKLADTIRQSHTELEEAIAIDPTNEPIQKNLQASQGLLGQLGI